MFAGGDRKERNLRKNNSNIMNHNDIHKKVVAKYIDVHRAVNDDESEGIMREKKTDSVAEIV